MNGTCLAGTSCICVFNLRLMYENKNMIVFKFCCSVAVKSRKINKVCFWNSQSAKHFSFERAISPIHWVNVMGIHRTLQMQAWGMPGGCLGRGGGG